MVWLDLICKFLEVHSAHLKKKKVQCFNYDVVILFNIMVEILILVGYSYMDIADSSLETSKTSPVF